MRYRINLRSKDYPFRVREVTIEFADEQALCSWLVGQVQEFWLVSVILVPKKSERPAAIDPDKGGQ